MSEHKCTEIFRTPGNHVNELLSKNASAFSLFPCILIVKPPRHKMLTTYHTTPDYLAGLRDEFVSLAQPLAKPHWSASDRFLAGLLYKVLSSSLLAETELVSLKLPGFALGPNFNEVLLYALAVVKYRQNYEASQQAPYVPQTGDWVYRKNDIYQVKGPLGSNKWGVSPVFPAKGGRILPGVHYPKAGKRRTGAGTYTVAPANS